MDKFSIKDIETLSGIKAHTIRIWEQRYCFLKPCRTSSNIRYYSCEELKTILNIAFLNKHGYKISHIEKMRTEEINEKVLQLTKKATTTEKTINDLLKQMIDLNVEKFEEILNDHFEKEGIESTVSHIIFPFIEQTGILHCSRFNSTYEHLVSPILRQKLLVAIDSNIIFPKNGKTAILFLPVSSEQELGILSVYYLLRKNGIESIYLGSDVPFHEAAHVAAIKKADIVFTQLVSDNRDKFINELRQHFSGFFTIIFDNLPQNSANKLPAGFQFKSSLSEMNNFLASL